MSSEPRVVVVLGHLLLGNLTLTPCKRKIQRWDPETGIPTTVEIQSYDITLFGRNVPMPERLDFGSQTYGYQQVDMIQLELEHFLRGIVDSVFGEETDKFQVRFDRTSSLKYYSGWIGYICSCSAETTEAHFPMNPELVVKIQRVFLELGMETFPRLIASLVFV